jgi:ABC-type transporter Mla MlaB component
LSRVTEIDSAALGMLLLVRDATIASQKRMSLASAGGRVREIPHVANFNSMMVEWRASRRACA